MPQTPKDDEAKFNEPLDRIFKTSPAPHKKKGAEPKPNDSRLEEDPENGRDTE